MHSIPSFVFSLRMKLLKLKKHKLAVNLSIVFVIVISVFGPTVYKESWLNPFSTLGVPNQELHPRAISMIGMINSDDPSHPLYYTNKRKIQELMRCLERAKPLSASEQAQLSLENQKIKYFTLHRESSRYHTEEDYALQYYPEKGIVCFAQQFFRINESSIVNFNQIENGMVSGWWN